MNKQYGFTLIELLITTVILLSVMSLAMFGYKQYTDQWSRNLSHIETAYDEYRLNELLSNALHGIVPYLVNSEQSVGFYFLGRSDGFTAVTQTPVFNPLYPAVIRVFTEQDTVGNYRLIYEEASLEHVFLVDPNQILPFNHRVTISEGLPFVSFNYYAISGTTEQIAAEGGSFTVTERKWLNQYDGLTMSYHPEQLSINIGGYSLYTTVASRANTLKNRSTPQND